MAVPYATRIQQIQDELFVAHLESEETVFDDQVADTLYGGSEQDWFFETGYMGIYRPADVEPYEPTPDTGSHSHPPIIVNAAAAFGRLRLHRFARQAERPPSR